MSTNEPTTIAARRLLVQLDREAAYWDNEAETDAPALQRARAAGWRNGIDWARKELEKALPEIERQAVDIEVSESARIDALLDAWEGVPA